MGPGLTMWDWNPIVMKDIVSKFWDCIVGQVAEFVEEPNLSSNTKRKNTYHKIILVESTWSQISTFVSSSRCQICQRYESVKGNKQEDVPSTKTFTSNGKSNFAIVPNSSRIKQKDELNHKKGVSNAKRRKKGRRTEQVRKFRIVTSNAFVSKGMTLDLKARITIRNLPRCISSRQKMRLRSK